MDNKGLAASEMVNIRSVEELHWLLSYLLHKMTDPRKEKNNFYNFFEQKLGYDVDYAKDLLSFRKPKVLSKELKGVLPALIDHYIDGPRQFSELLEYGKGPSIVTEVSYDFIGREKELSEIESHFQKPHTYDKSNTLVICRNISGPGGQGKTALAREYAKRFRKKYSAILEIDCDEEIVYDRLIDFSLENNIPVPINEPKIKKEKAIKYLQALARKYPKKVLIIFDNVQTKKSKRSEIVETIIRKTVSKNIHFIITSRESMLMNRAKLLDLDPLSEVDAAELFINRSRLIGKKSSDNDVIDLTTKILGGHALSVAIIASYVRENNIDNLLQLGKKIEQIGIVQSEITSKITLREYPRSLYSALEISFESIGLLGSHNQLLFMMLSLFPRYSIPIKVIKESILLMQPDENPTISSLVSDFKTKGNDPKPLQNLVKHSLLEKTERSIHMHEVIFDYARYKWSKLLESRDNCVELSEVSFTESSSEYASRKLSDGNISYDELKSLAGLLMPQPNIERNYKPSFSRINTCLDFWYNNYRFHQFVYDTEIQELLLPSMISLKEYLIDNYSLDNKKEILLNKLIGHAYYGSPKEKGEDAFRLFSDAYELTVKSENNVDTIWYSIFLKDHMLNVASKNRDKTKETVPLYEDDEYVEGLRSIEFKLPETLASLKNKPDDMTLLLRAAHFWGHRGNQDSYVLYKQLILNKFDKTTPRLVAESISHYEKAINYRIAALKNCRPNKHVRKIDAMLCSWPYIANWTEGFEGNQTNSRIEGFTSLYQGIGDTAHQYRGLNFVLLTNSIIEYAQGKENVSLSNTLGTYKAAEELWKIAEKARGKNEVPIKYMIWMCSSKVISEVVERYINENTLPTVSELTENINDEVKKVQSKLTNGYTYGADEQLTQAKEILSVLYSVKKGKTLKLGV